MKVESGDIRAAFNDLLGRVAVKSDADKLQNLIHLAVQYMAQSEPMIRTTVVRAILDDVLHTSAAQMDVPLSKERAVACTDCGALPGEPCAASTKRIARWRGDVHQTRWRAARTGRTRNSQPKSEARQTTKKETAT